MSNMDFKGIKTLELVKTFFYVTWEPVECEGYEFYIRAGNSDVFDKAFLTMHQLDCSVNSALLHYKGSFDPELEEGQTYYCGIIAIGVEKQDKCVMSVQYRKVPLNEIFPCPKCDGTGIDI